MNEVELILTNKIQQQQNMINILVSELHAAQDSNNVDAQVSLAIQVTRANLEFQCQRDALQFYQTHIKGAR